MDIKTKIEDAIYFLEGEQKLHCDLCIQELPCVRKEYNKVFSLLRRLKRYYKIWEAFLDLPLGYFVKSDDAEMYFGKIYDLEEKYLLKKDRVIEKIKAKGGKIKDVYI